LVKFIRMIKKKDHWNKVFKTKTPQEVSWTEAYPKNSIDFINTLNLNISLPIIDVGGGDSHLVEALLEKGHTDVSVLDISKTAIKNAQERLGNRSKKVTWIISDILDFKPKKKYTLWHDRASFHFLTNSSDINCYKDLVNQWVENYLILGTFSKKGPLKCSGLPITQYSCKSITKNFQKKFDLIKCKYVIHETPFETKQHFLFSSLKKKDQDP
tara:strand:- start:7483 stop:8121 length:639 start_codon:yes stop_codon:yes gene_type:complete